MTIGTVSAIIPVYNRPRMVREAVASVLAQTYRPIEIILVDDGSTDDTPAVVDELAAEHPEVTAIHQANAGPGVARETGRQAAGGEFIQYLDSDDLLLPRKFELQVAALRKHPDCGIAYGITRLIDGEGRVLEEPYKWTGRRMEFLFPALLVDRWWNTETPLWRQEASDAAGPWPDMRMSEDWLFDARAGARRVKLAYVAEPVAAHCQHPDHRLTSGRLDVGKTRDIAELLCSLLPCAQKAGVPRESPEMRHFSRWAFTHARRCGALGIRDEASRLLEVARQSCAGSTADIDLVAMASRAVGWRTTVKLCELLYKVLRRGPGKHTQGKSV